MKDRKSCDVATNNAYKRLDQLQVAISNNLQPSDCPVVHRFTKGLYSREISVPAGTVIVSKIHKSQHPYIISKGRVLVSENMEQLTERSAPYTGITQPGTRRVIIALEDSVWTTFHPHLTIKGNENELPEAEQEKIVAKIEKKIIQKRHINEEKILEEINNNRKGLTL